MRILLVATFTSSSFVIGHQPSSPSLITSLPSFTITSTRHHHSLDRRHHACYIVTRRSLSVSSSHHRHRHFRSSRHCCLTITTYYVSHYALFFDIVITSSLVAYAAYFPPLESCAWRRYASFIVALSMLTFIITPPMHAAIHLLYYCFIINITITLFFFASLILLLHHYAPFSTLIRSHYCHFSRFLSSPILPPLRAYTLAAAIGYVYDVTMSYLLILITMLRFCYFFSVTLRDYHGHCQPPRLRCHLVFYACHHITVNFVAWGNTKYQPMSASSLRVSQT